MTCPALILRHDAQRRQRLTPIVIALLAIGVSGSATAQVSPYYIGASQAFSHDSNIFRVADGNPESSDVWSTTSLLMGIDQPIGRQRVYADANISYNKYQDLDQLDGTAYLVGLGLDWATVERLSGTLKFNASETLGNYGAADTPATTEKNTERSQDALASVRLGSAAARFNLEGTLSHRELDYSLDSWDRYDYQRDTVGLHVIYRPKGGAPEAEGRAPLIALEHPAPLTLGAGARHTRGTFPRFAKDPSGAYIADDYERNDIDLTAIWQATGASRVNARISFTDESHDIAGARDFSDWTGAIVWDWRPTGKLHFLTELARDSGQELNPLTSGGGTITAVGDTSRLADRIQVRAFYDATAKIQLDALARYTHGSLVNTVSPPGGVVTTAAGNENTTALALGVRYNPTRTIQIGCSIGTESRNGDSTVSYDYSADYASCFAQIVLR
jgi:hypothetical protein